MLATTSKAARRKSGAGRTGWSAASPRVEVVLIEVVEPATASVEVGTAKATTAMRWTTRARPSRSTRATAVEVVRRPAKFETRIVHRWSEVRWMRAVMGRHVWRHSSGRGEGWWNVNPGHDPELGHGFGLGLQYVEFFSAELGLSRRWHEGRHNVADTGCRQNVAQSRS